MDAIVRALQFLLEQALMVQGATKFFNYPSLQRGLNLALAVAVWAAGAGAAWLLFRYLTPKKLFFTEDLATSFAVSREMLHGDFPLLGPPSHTGGRHFGAFYYWLIGLALFLTGNDAAQAITLLCAVNFASVLFIGLSFARLYTGTSRRMALLGGALAALSYPCLVVLRDPWQPHFQLFSSALLVYAALCCLERIGAWPLLLFALTVAIQTHYASGPLAAVIAAVVFARWIASFRRSFLSSSAGARLRPAPVRPALDSPTSGLLLLVLTVLLWVPPAVYELAISGNALKVLRPHLAGTEQVIGLRQAAPAVIRYLPRFSPLFDPNPQWKREPLLYRSALFFFCLPLAGGCLRLARKRPWFAAALVLPLPVYAAVVARLVPPFHNYYLHALLPWPIMLSGIAFAEIGIPAYGIRPPLRLAMRAVYGFAALLFCACVLRSAAWASSVFQSMPFARWHSLAHAQEMAGAILQDSSASADVQIIGRGGAAISENAYYYFLGSDNAARMRYHEAFKELSRLQRAAAPADKAYVVVCPVPDARQWRRMWDDVEKNWRREAEVPLAGRRFCRSCRLFRLARLDGADKENARAQ